MKEPPHVDVNSVCVQSHVNSWGIIDLLEESFLTWKIQAVRAEWFRLIDSQTKIQDGITRNSVKNLRLGQGCSNLREALAHQNHMIMIILQAFISPPPPKKKKKKETVFAETNKMETIFSLIKICPQNKYCSSGPVAKKNSV